MKNLPNIIWILIDSVRHYQTNADERGRLPVMDKFAKDAIDFRVAITAAPSTIMSVSAMMTGLPAGFQSRDYNSFKYNFESLISLPNILKQNGYNTYGLISWPDGRNFLGKMFGDICEDLWKNKYNPNEFWSNDIQVDLFSSFLDSEKINSPFFVWLHTNCRNDVNISDKIEKLLNKIKEKKLYEDSIIIINSDHGYPDPNRKISFYEKRKFGHDLIMTDDNILAPQLIKFPNIDHQRIDNPISTLDLFPTILEFLNLSESYNYSDYSIKGRSLLNFIKGDSEWNTEIVRTDNRFIFQTNRVTALRNNKFKYIHYYGLKEDDFFDIMNDKLEEENLINCKKHESEVYRFTNELQKQNKALLNFHKRLLSNQLNTLVHDERFILIGEFNQAFIKVITDIFLDKNYSISKNKFYNQQLLMISDKIEKKYPNLNQLYFIPVNKSPKKNNIIVFPVSNNPLINTQIKKAYLTFNRMKETKLHIFNYNFNSIQFPEIYYKVFFKKFMKRLPMLKTQPLTLFYDVLIWSKKIIFMNK